MEKQEGQAMTEDTLKELSKIYYNWDDLSEKQFINQIMRLITETNQLSREEENESFKSVFDDTQTWAGKCYLHEKYSPQCHACKKNKWFMELSKEVIPIIEDRLTELKSSKGKA